MRHIDNDYEDWKPGDELIWDIDDDTEHTVQITKIDEHGRVFWREDDGEEVLTRATNMARVRED